jgi:hypothetical protein
MGDKTPQKYIAKIKIHNSENTIEIKHNMKNTIT